MATRASELLRVAGGQAAGRDVGIRCAVTVKGDSEKKKETYRGMGVREYWLVDPVGGVYEPLPCEEAPDGMVTVWSPLLQLEVRFANPIVAVGCNLVFHD